MLPAVRFWMTRYGEFGKHRPHDDITDVPHMGVSYKLQVPLWGPHNKDHHIWGFILGFTYLGKVLYWRCPLLN